MLKYHKYSGNVALKTSFEEFFGVYGNKDNVLFPRNILPVLKTIRISNDDYLNNHSAMPFYKVFLSKINYKKIHHKMFNGKESYIGLIHKEVHTGEINRLRYCPKCLRESMNYSVIKTVHQLSGVHVCRKHHCYLNTIYTTPYKVLIDINNWDMTVSPCTEGGILEQVAEDAEYILSNNVDLALDDIKDKLFDIAIEKGIYHCSKWNDEIFSEWKEYYKELPEAYQGLKKIASFERYADTTKKLQIDPAEYLIFIQSIFGSFENFIKGFNINYESYNSKDVYTASLFFYSFIYKKQDILSFQAL